MRDGMGHPAHRAAAQAIRKRADARSGVPSSSKRRIAGFRAASKISDVRRARVQLQLVGKQADADSGAPTPGRLISAALAVRQPFVWLASR
jgi:hypothetical protein